MAIYIGSQKIKPSGISKIYVGTTLVYKKQSWHTVWSGSRKIGVKWKTTSTGSNTTSGTGSMFSSGLNPGVTTKITFSLSNVNTSDSNLTKKGTQTGTFTLTSPVEFTSAALGQDLIYGLIYYTGATSLKFNFSLNSTSNGGCSVWIGNISGYSSYGRESYITVTKIEQYY